ncbi:MAG TPA: cytochrome c oxidase subunit II [Woeseiaceae bacterium]|nr:cytochrome c oxidase subunit II [Woeseiaceae bacterium]
MSGAMPLDDAVQILPAQASSVAADVDALFYAILAACVIVCLILFVLIWRFSLKYWHSRDADREAHEPQGFRLEFAWTVIPLLVFIGFFVWGARLYLKIEVPPPDALQVHALARQWMWKFEHPGGQREINTLHVPLGRPVTVTLISQDVIHSFFVPAFRIKQDVLPNRYTRIWFEAIEPGRFRLFCAEFCGTSHAGMRGEVIVMPPAEYQAWLASSAPAESLVARGQRMFRSAGCSGCHDPRSTVHAPDLHGIFGRTVQLRGGATAVADEAYLRDSMLLPDSRVTAGFAPLMPSFAGQLDEGEITAIIAYIKSLDAGDSE